MTMVYILDGHEPMPCKNFDEWAQWFETAERHVVFTRLIDGSAISTVFLGVDHGWQRDAPPVLFETALLTEDGASVCNRYATWAEAEAGHMEWLERCVPGELIDATTKEHGDTNAQR